MRRKIVAKFADGEIDSKTIVNDNQAGSALRRRLGEIRAEFRPLKGGNFDIGHEIGSGFGGWKLLRTLQN